MPCRSDYLEPSGYEVELSRVMCLLGELEGETFQPSWWRGMHPLAYGRRRAQDALGALADGADDLDELTAALCQKLDGQDLTKYSLEMQMWARDHKEADRRRKLLEAAQKNRDALIASARAKLTPAEQRALGLELEPDSPFFKPGV